MPSPAVMAAAVAGTALAVLLNHWVALLTLDVLVFGVVTPLSFALTIRLGPWMAVASALGAVAGHLMLGVPWLGCLLAGVATAAGPLLVVLCLPKPAPTRSAFKRRLAMMTHGLLVVTPLSALAYWLAGAPYQHGAWEPEHRFLFLLASDSLGLVLFGPVVLTLMPDASDKDPHLALSGRSTGFSVALTAALLAIAHALGVNEQILLAQICLFLVAAAALGPVIMGSARVSALMVAWTGIALLVEQSFLIREGAHLLMLGPEQRVIALGVLLTMGAFVLHLLNAVAIRSAAQRKELEEQVLKNPFSGLPNRLHFFRTIKALTSRSERQQAFFAEIAIPDLHFLAEFSGREAVYRVDTLIATTLASSLQTHAMGLSHASLGSYFVQLQATADPLAVIDAVEAGVLQACTHSDMRRMRVRPHIALLRVPADLKLDAEDILSSLSLALQRSEKSLKRWSMSTLQQGILNKQREDIRESETLVDLLSQSQVLVYAQLIQPLAGTPDEGLHFEVLARMKGADGQVISPARFLPVYTAYGLLTQFDCQVIEHLFDQLSREPGLVRAIRSCSINLTGPTIADPHLLPFIEAQFAGALIEPRQVIFEITESNHISSQQQALENVAALRALGCSIALDDFGTGLATFDYLKSFKPDWIKIDGSFVREADANPINREVVSSMIRVAMVAGARAVAEQVEDQKSIDLMRDLGAHYVQGYAIAKPEPLASFAGRMMELRRARVSKLSGARPAPAAAQSLEPAGVADA